VVTVAGMGECQWSVEGQGEGGGGKGLGNGAGGGDSARAEDQGVTEGGDDFLDVMGDQDEGGVWVPAEVGEELQEVLTGHRVEPGAGFVENEQIRLGHEGAGDEDALAFALGEDGPGAVGQVQETDVAQPLSGAGEVGARDRGAQVNGGLASGGDDFQGGFLIVQEVTEGGGHEADASAESGPIGLAVGLAEELDLAGGWGEVTGEGGEERGFAGAIGAEEHPMLSGENGPMDVLEDGMTPAGDGQAGEPEHGNGCGGGGWGGSGCFGHGQERASGGRVGWAG
jgi:hypothetical protein